MPKKLTYEQVKSFIEEQGYQLLSTEYKYSTAKLKLQCPKGHKFKAAYNNFKRGSRCLVCENKKRSKTYKDVKYYIESFDYKLLSDEYKNTRTKLKLQCPEGHIYKVTYSNFQQGNRCPTCYYKITYKDVKYYIESFDYKLLSDEYKNTITKLKLQCPKGHIFKMSYNHFKRGQRCPTCWYTSKSSKLERELQNFVSTIYNGKMISNDRNTIINPLTGHNLELDVYLPKLNKAIEFNGGYWHSFYKVKNKDKIKQEQCKYNNITLLTIHEDNWVNNKEMCLQVIENFINN